VFSFCWSSRPDTEQWYCSIEAGDNVRAVYGTFDRSSGYLTMPDFPIDPELRIRATPSIVLRRTTQAIDFIRRLILSSSDRAWRDLLQSFEAARDEWSAMEAVVKLELLLEAEGLLIEEETAYASRSDQGRSRAA
jgi:hypothetical protein